MPSFNVVSEIDSHELTNAVDQASRELSQRFDFKGTGARFELEETTVTMSRPSEFQLNQMLEILEAQGRQARHRRRCVSTCRIALVNLAVAKQQVILKHGIDQDTGSKVSRLLKDSKLKVQAQIQGDKVRVTGKKRDDLQEAIATLRKGELRGPAAVQQFPGLIAARRGRPANGRLLRGRFPAHPLGGRPPSRRARR